MGYSHVDLKWKDIVEQLEKYVDRYFELRFGNVSEEERAPLRGNEKGALQGYLQSFADKNGKWIGRLNIIMSKLKESYKEQGFDEPEEMDILKLGFNDLSVEDRIRLPLKAMYRLSFLGLLKSEENVIVYDEDGNLDRVNLSTEELPMAINLFALTASLANRVAHASSRPEEYCESYEYKHKMIALLLTSVYDYNKDSKDKIDCKFAKLPSSKDGHSHPAFTVKLKKPNDIGKISIHFGGCDSSVKMLFDCLPERLKLDPNYMKVLNEGFIGDVKSQNVPGVQSILDLCKNNDVEKEESR